MHKKILHKILQIFYLKTALTLQERIQLGITV